MSTFDFKSFDFIDSWIHLPYNTILYRGIETSIPKTKVLRDYPMYLAPEYIAKFYGNVYKLKCKMPIKLMDIRKMIGILKHLLSSLTTIDQDCMNFCATLSMSYGLISYRSQIGALLKYYDHMKASIKPDMFEKIKEKIANMQNYNFSNQPHNPIEIQGVRTGDVYLNGLSVSLLKELFSDICDGYVAPRLFSPYQEENFIHEEIVIFDPVRKLEIVEDVNPAQHNISSLFSGPSYTIKKKQFLQEKMYFGGTFKTSQDDFNKFFDDKANIKKAKDIVKTMRKVFKVNKNTQTVFSPLINAYKDNMITI